MITCSQCGGTNDLGRVFCTTCGAKLELTALSNEEVPIRGQGGSGGKIAAAVVVMILVSALVLAGLCFVPVSDAIGEQGSPSSVHNVAGPLRALSGLRSGQSLGRSFPESDINGYLALAVVKRARV